jgi:hypothetical protein
MPHPMGIKQSILLTQTALLIALVSLSCASAVAQPSNGAHQLARPTGDAFVVPLRIDSYGNAWDGYLAFGLWEYNRTDFSHPVHSYLVVMTTKGQLLDLRQTDNDQSYWPVKYMSQDTLMYEGEPETSTHFWNLKTNETTDFPDVYGHHDMVFNPVTGTFLTLRGYVRDISGRKVLMDKIVELNDKGETLWTWDTYSDGHFDLSDACQCNDTTRVNGKTVIDLTHSNSLQWNYDQNIIYLNMRHLNTLCKIDKTTGQTVWCLGEHGNFTLLDSNGQKVSSLWFHSHDVKEVQPNVFSMFDDDYHNTSNTADRCPATFEETNAHSRIIEVAMNEQNMTAWVNWSWTAPRQYWTPYWGGSDRLPNGDRIGVFGSQSHYLPGSTIPSPLPNSTGAAVVEVNPNGEVVRTYIFPYGWGIYRVREIALQTLNDYDRTLRTNDFTINLSTINDLGGPADIYYRINSGTVKAVSIDGQPHITAKGINNTLEYWSVDNGVEESPHDIMTGIELQPTSPLSANIVPAIAAVAAATLAISFAVMVMRKRRNHHTVRN